MILMPIDHAARIHVAMRQDDLGCSLGVELQHVRDPKSASQHHFQAVVATIAGFMVEADKLVNNVLLDLSLAGFLKGVTQ